MCSEHSNLSMVCEADVELTTNTSGHLDNALMATNNNHLPHTFITTPRRAFYVRIRL